MILLTAFFGLNLLGLFNFFLPPKILNILSYRGEGFVGDFITGITLTLLATPCTAPLVGTAVGFALSGGIFEIFFIVIQKVEIEFPRCSALSVPPQLPDCHFVRKGQVLNHVLQPAWPCPMQTAIQQPPPPSHPTTASASAPAPPSPPAPQPDERPPQQLLPRSREEGTAVIERVLQVSAAVPLRRLRCTAGA